MKLDDVILEADRDISFLEKEISKLQNKKQKFQKLKEQYPEAHYNGGALCLPNIWDKVTGMRIERKRRYYSTSTIFVKFLAGKKHMVDGAKIYSLPYESPVAEIHHTFGVNRKKEILIFDYKSIVPDNCPRRNSFVKRIKLYLVRTIMQDGLTIADASHDKEEISKLILLR